MQCFHSQSAPAISVHAIPVQVRHLLLIFVCLFSSQQTFAETVFTSFEFNVNGTFNVGQSPFTATFSGGIAESRDNTALYVSGTNAWHIPPSVTATTTFETNPDEITFFVRNDSGAVTSQVRVIDESESVIQTITVTNSFQKISVARTSTESLIKRLEYQNMGGGDIVVDDFTFNANQPPAAFDPSNPIPEPIATGSVQIQLTDIATGLVSPLWGTFSPVDTSRLFIVDQVGVLNAIDLNTTVVSTFLDVSGRLVQLGAFGPNSFDERGFLGFAFHPNYALNGLLYTYTSEPVAGSADFSTLSTGQTANHQSLVTEWQVPTPLDPTSVVDDSSARELLRIDQPQFNHNGGALNFDTNGYLYISLGDGGNADDEGDGHGVSGNGQDKSNPLGALLRIDPLGTNSKNGQYGIPATNPFFGGSEVQEIYAYGFRNPFRFSIDPQTGDIWLADVGQNHIEEVNRVIPGGNFGWSHKEGTFFFNGNGSSDGTVTDQDPGVPAGLIDPLAQFDHDEGIAIIGGFIYRGNAIPDLVGRYVFGDFGSFSADAGRIFYLNANNEIRAFGSPFSFAVLGFAQDMNGEIYVLSNTTGTPFGTTGKVMRLDAVDETDNSGAGSGSSGCFIATAAFGSPLHPYVNNLRQFRDQYMLTNTAGRALVDFYYRHSPPIAAYISVRPWLRTATQIILAPVVFTAAYPMIALFSAVGFVFIIIRRRSSNKLKMENHH